MTKPNILVIMTDQQRRDSLGCYDADWVPTPNLDRLASQGTLFEACTVNNPICTPSRASIFTGRELPGHGVYRLHDNLPADQMLFPELLRSQAGYRTALFGKQHVSGRVTEERVRHPNDGYEIYEWCLEASVGMDSRFNGYVDWLRRVDPAFLDALRRDGRDVLHHPERVHFTSWAAERTSDFIRQQTKADQPFFCLMSIFDPHNPYQDFPDAMAARIDAGCIPEPIERDTLPGTVRREQAGSYLGDARDLSPEAIMKMRFGYAASLAFADLKIGEVLATLDEVGLADDTLVIFLSDHGDSLGDHGMLVKSVALYEPVVGVPLIMRWPGQVPAGKRSRALVQGHDIAGTCLAAAGLANGVPESLDLTKVAKGDADARAFAVCAYRNSGISNTGAYWDPPMQSTMVRSADHKLIAYSSGGEAEFELFDLGDDPKEQTDRFGDPAYTAIQSTLMQSLVGWLQNEAASIGSRGGSALPDASQQLDNTFKG